MADRHTDWTSVKPANIASGGKCGIEGQPSNVQQLLEKMREACWADVPSDVEVVQRGTGMHLGMAITWTSAVRASGAFHETTISPMMTHRIGYNGVSTTESWEVDYSGVSRPLELDDYEASVLGTWVRSSLWLSPSLLPRLRVRRLLPSESADPLLWSHVDKPDPVTWDGHVSTAGNLNPSDSGGRGFDSHDSQNGIEDKSSGNGLGSTAYEQLAVSRSYMDDSSCTEAEESVSLPAVPLTLTTDPVQKAVQGGLASQSDTLSSGGHDSGLAVDGDLSDMSDSTTDNTFLAISLVGCKLAAKMEVDTMTWRPRSLSFLMCGDVETWRYSWPQKPTAPGLLMSEEYSHKAAGGGHNSYAVEATYAGVVSPQGDEQYLCPPHRALPAGATYDASISADVQAWRTSSGHTLVKPLINDTPVGFMLLDSGASGLVIEKSVADELGLLAQGELHVSGVAGKSASCLRTADSIQIGPLKMDAPQFYEMGLGSLVSGGPDGGKVVGVIGYDIFRRTLMELPKPPATRRSPYFIRLHDPRLGADVAFADVEGASSAEWLRLGMVAGLPLIAAQLPLQQPEVRGLQQQQQQQEVRGQQHQGKPHSGMIVASSGSNGVPVSESIGSMSDSIGSVSDSILGCDPPQEAVLDTWLLLDSGAGGSDIMFSQRSFKQLQVDQRKGSASRSIRGIGGQAGSSTKAITARLPWVQLGKQRLESPKCLFADTGFELSTYSGGLLCGDLISRGTLLLDFGKRQAAFLHNEADA